MHWSQRLERILGIEVKTCAACCGTMRIIDDRLVIEAIFAHLANKAHPMHALRLQPGQSRRRIL